MSDDAARTPGDLARLFVERINAGDVEGLVTLYEPDATLAAGEVKARGSEEIRSFYANLLERRSEFPSPELLPAIENDGLALTCARTPAGSLSVEVARRQNDGRWLWVIDQLKLKLTPSS